MLEYLFFFSFSAVASDSLRFVPSRVSAAAWEGCAGQGEEAVLRGKGTLWGGAQTLHGGSYQARAGGERGGGDADDTASVPWGEGGFDDTASVPWGEEGVLMTPLQCHEGRRGCWGHRFSAMRGGGDADDTASVPWGEERGADDTASVLWGGWGIDDTASVPWGEEGVLMTLLQCQLALWSQVNLTAQLCGAQPHTDLFTSKQNVWHAEETVNCYNKL